MSDRYDVMTPIKRPNSEKAFWLKVGSAWEAKDGKGMDISLDAVPVGEAGSIRLIVRPPLPKDGEKKSYASKDRVSRPAFDDSEDPGAF